LAEYSPSVRGSNGGLDEKNEGEGSCAQNWPALTVAAGSSPVLGSGVTGNVSQITRPDGIMQVALNGIPLYYFSGDKAPGDANGQGVGGVWVVAAP